MKTISKKTIVISIILLLVGVSVSSAISVDTQSTISNNESEDCKECNEISKSDMVKVERLLDRVEVYSKLLLVLSRNNPELRGISERLSKRISTFDDAPIICAIIESIFHSLGFMLEPLYEYINNFNGSEIIKQILISIAVVYAGILSPIWAVGEIFGCWDE
jgi:hypothetical protein